MQVKVPVETREKQMCDTQKIAIFAASDRKGEVFIQLEAQASGKTILIKEDYDQGRAMKEDLKIIRDFIVRQTKEIERRNHGTF